MGYTDGYLPEGRRELVEAHLLACVHCRRRMATFREVDELIRSGTNLADDPRHLATLKARLVAEARPRLRPWTLRRSLAVVPALALLLGLLAWPLASLADFPLGKFIHFGLVQGDRRTSNGDKLARVDSVSNLQTRDNRSTSWLVAPPSLPPDLALVEQSSLGASRLELFYRGPDGVAVLVAETPAHEAGVSYQPAGGEGILNVRDTEVYLLPDPRPEMVAGLLWEREGIFFELLVTEPVGLNQTDAVQIVEALMLAQDAGAD